MTEVGQRITLARECLAAMRQRDINYLPPSKRAPKSARPGGSPSGAWRCRRAGDAAEGLAAIRAVLAALDWEFRDPAARRSVARSAPCPRAGSGKTAAT